MTLFNKKTIGKQFEELASAYLQKQGLRLINKNYRSYFGEIDLIMRDREDIVFVEVRSRKRHDYGHVIESINYAKQKKLIKTAILFLQEKKWLYKICSRFDVITIHMSENKPQLEWVKNAFSGD